MTHAEAKQLRYWWLIPALKRIGSSSGGEKMPIFLAAGGGDSQSVPGLSLTLAWDHFLTVPPLTEKKCSLGGEKLGGSLFLTNSLHQKVMNNGVKLSQTVHFYSCLSFFVWINNPVKLWGGRAESEEINTPMNCILFSLRSESVQYKSK